MDALLKSTKLVRALPLFSGLPTEASARQGLIPCRCRLDLPLSCVLPSLPTHAGTTLRFRPGVITGGAGLVHDCGRERPIGYFLEALVLLALFGKKVFPPLAILTLSAGSYRESLAVRAQKSMCIHCGCPEAWSTARLARHRAGCTSAASPSVHSQSPFQPCCAKLPRLHL